MRPLFPFYGSKWRDARRYPGPIGPVVEPFAGSAGYSTFYGVPTVSLVDADPIIVGVWQYLISATPREILALPDLEVGQNIDTLEVSQEARWLIGFWLNRGSATPKKTKTAYSARTDRAQLIWGERARQRIARDILDIRGWTVTHGTYEEAPISPVATYFVDPPYGDKGRYYRYREVDYAALGAWCSQLRDVIVCEQEGATWLPFEPLASIKSSKGRSAEVSYSSRRVERLFAA